MARAHLRQRGGHEVAAACRGGVDRQAAQLHGRKHRAQRARLEVPQQARHDARAQRGYEYALRRGGVAALREPLPVSRLLLGGGAKFQEQLALVRVSFGGGNLAIEPGGFFLVVPAVKTGCGQYSSRCSSSHRPRPRRHRHRHRPRRRPRPSPPHPRPHLVLGLGPALRLLMLFQVHLVPGLDVDLLDVAIEVLDLDAVPNPRPPTARGTALLLRGSRTTGRVPVRNLCSPRKPSCRLVRRRVSVGAALVLGQRSPNAYSFRFMTARRSRSRSASHAGAAHRRQGRLRAPG